MNPSFFSQKALLLSMILLVGLGGCATQTAYRSYSEARDAYQQAYQLKPDSIYLKEARIDLEAGKTYLDEARFDRAIDNFEKSMIRSKAVIDLVADQKVNQAQSPAVVLPSSEQRSREVASKDPVSTQEEIEKLQNELEQPQAKKEASRTAERSAEQTRDSYKKRGLPREALARYLSGKREGSVRTKAEVLETMDEAATKAASAAPKTASPKPAPKESTAPQAVAAKKPARSADPEFDEGVQRRAKEMENARKKEVRASSKPQVRPDPQAVDVPGEDELTDEPQTVAAAAAPAEEKKPEMNKRKIPGKIPFVAQDPSLQPEAMGTLNQISKYLLENPSTTLFLKGILAAKEADSYIAARFESIRSYLTGKGVPEDQVRLEDGFSRGKIAEFEMYLVEH